MISNDRSSRYCALWPATRVCHSAHNSAVLAKIRNYYNTELLKETCFHNKISKMKVTQASRKVKTLILLYTTTTTTTTLILLVCFVYS